MKKYDFYLASGWFNPEQEKARQDILKVLKEYKAKYFSPREEIVCAPDANEEEQQKVFDGNINAIKDSFFMIASTVGKDMGTLHETGHASALNIPIIYYCPGLKGNFNLMLAQTAIAVATTEEELQEHVENILNNKFYTKKYRGTIE